MGSTDNIQYSEENQESSLVNMHKAVGTARGPIVVCVVTVNARCSIRGIYLHCGAASCYPPTSLIFPNHTIRFLTRLIGRFLHSLHSIWLKKKLPACCSGKAWILVQSAKVWIPLVLCIEYKRVHQTDIYLANKDRTFTWRCMREGGLFTPLGATGKPFFRSIGDLRMT